ncbi:hypothetical protein QTP88_010616 [Uroleucon formosanum]
MPEEATDLVEYFERAYVGSYRRVGNGQSETRIKLQKTSPYFPPSVWNANHKHPTIWTLITKMRHENAAHETKVAQRQLGTIGPPLKNKRKDILKHLCEKYNDGSRDIPNFLNAIANFIRN